MYSLETKVDISFIIPAFNEESYIESTVNSIKCDSGYDLAISKEIIVVDNGSTDNTVALARKAGAVVLAKDDGNIGSVRNYGVKHAQGQVLIFLDADVCLTQKWFQTIEEVLNKFIADPLLVTGSHCAPPRSENWFLKYWYQSFSEEKNVSHLGSGHLIMTKALFEQIGGFSETLQTGEDYDICQKAKNAGGQIVNNIDLAVVHNDFPTTIRQFIKREAWHGVGDYANAKLALSSKVVLASLLFLCLHVFGALFLLVNANVTYLCILLLFGLLLASSVVKNKHSSMTAIIVNALIFYLYYWGRVSSAWYALRK